MNKQFEREEDDLVERLNRGEITPQEYRREISELHRAWRDAAHEAAQDAYERELGQW